MQNKCVMVLDEQLPTGLVANTAAIMGLSLGKLFPGAVGADVCDASGHIHAGITETPVPILKSDTEGLKALRERLYQDEFAGVSVVDFSRLAQLCKTYDEFTGRMAGVPSDALEYLGLALCGEKKAGQPPHRQPALAALSRTHMVAKQFAFTPCAKPCTQRGRCGIITVKRTRKEGNAHGTSNRQKKGIQRHPAIGWVYAWQLYRRYQQLGTPADRV